MLTSSNYFTSPSTSKSKWMLICVLIASCLALYLTYAPLPGTTMAKKKKLFCRYSLRYCRVVTSQKLQKMLMTHLAPGAIQKCLAYLHFFAIEHLWTGGVRCLGERRRPVSVPRCFMELLDGSISLVCDF